MVACPSRLTAKRPSAQHPFTRRSRGHSGLRLPSWHRALAAPRAHWRHAAAAASPQSQFGGREGGGGDDAGGLRIRRPLRLTLLAYTGRQCYANSAYVL
uniref:Uncharacterized protein n=1 Tax=Oryza sativa subsp. japonica TaxID=39947 RepID=Q6L4N1_ORYSJ|nr:unknown protein [Oryza sativa Japonica Group]